VRERLGDPQVVPGFRCPLRPVMPSSMTPGSSTMISSRAATSIFAFAENRAARHSRWSRNPFHAGKDFGASWFTHLLRPARLLDALYGSDRFPSHRRLLHPGFQRFGHPPRCQI